jgi:predicted dehydrogenase
MVELARQKNLVLACAPSTILLSAYQHIKELVEAGQIGRICFAQALGAHGGPARWDDFTGDPAWFYQPGGGPLFDLAVYPIHILTQILGPVTRVTAFSGLAVPEILATAQKMRGQTIKAEVDDTTLAVLDFGNATLAMVGASYNMLSSRLPEMQIWGSEGALTAPQFLGDEVGIWQRSHPEWKLQHLPATMYDQLGLGAGLSHWLDCILAGTEPVNNGRHGQHVLDVLLSIQASAQRGMAIELATGF